MIEKKKKKLKLVLAVAVPVLIAAAVFAVQFSGGGESNGEIPTFDVNRGPLTISVDASGSIKALDQIVITCKVKGERGAMVLSIVPEGTRVKKGELLITLDSSDFEDALVAEEITLQNAKTTLISAEESLAVGKNQAESDLEKANLALEFAQADLKKYVEGDYLNQVTDANAQIIVKEEALQQAEGKLEGSQRLFKDKYISATELKRDELAKSRAKLEVDLAKNQLKLLQDFTYPRQIKQLESDIWQAEMAAERAKRKARADVVLLEAALLEAKSTLERQDGIVKKLQENIANTKIYAPADGMVVYASSQRERWGSSEPLDVGQQVRERQELIHLPTSDKVKAEIKVHESSMQKIKVGLPAVVMVDALSEKTFTGQVAKIAMLPDAQMVWLNPDLKVYAAEINLDGGGNGLRTGMSCRASIVVKEYDDVVFVPVQAVVRIGDKPTVYVVKDGKSEPRNVEIGLDNNRMVHVISGVEFGETVLLAPPLASTETQNSKTRDAMLERDKVEPGGPDDDMPPVGPDGGVMPGSEGSRRPRGGEGGFDRIRGQGVGSEPDGTRPSGAGGSRPGGTRPGGAGGSRPGGSSGGSRPGRPDEAIKGVPAP